MSKKIVKSKDGVKKESLFYLLLAVTEIAIVSGIMVDSVEAVGQKLGLTELFIGTVTV